MRWDGCAAPWSKEKAPCPQCGTTHQLSVHERFMRCLAWRLAFVELWLSSWEEWRPHVTQWLDEARPADLHHIGRLRILSVRVIAQFLIDHITAECMLQMRYQVVWHQYHMLIGVAQLLTMQPRAIAEGMEPLEERETPWYPKPRQVTPNPTIKNIREQCCYKRLTSRKRAVPPPPPPAAFRRTSE